MELTVRQDECRFASYHHASSLSLSLFFSFAVFLFPTLSDQQRHYPFISLIFRLARSTLTVRLSFFQRKLRTAQTRFASPRCGAIEFLDKILRIVEHQRRYILQGG